MAKNKKVLIAGGSGLIGSALLRFLKQKGFEVSILSRNTKNKSVKTFLWNPMSLESDNNAFVGQDYIINLAGAGIADKFWTKGRKNEILESRLNVTKLIADGIIHSESRPKMVIQASAIGYYGDRPHERLTEQSSNGNGFLSSVCYKWENETSKLREYQIPVAILRTGVVLSEEGGYLQKMRKILKSRVNLCFGTGEQMVSWVHISDLLNMFLFLIESEKSGIYNAVSPNPVASIKLQNLIASQSGFKTLNIKTNPKLIRFLFGDFSEVFLNDQYVIPQMLNDVDFKFAYPSLASALQNLIK